MEHSLIPHPRRAVPHYSLYGEHASRAAPGFVHIETLSARSALHDWEIAPHLHEGLRQVFWISEGGGAARLDRDRIAFKAPALIVVPVASAQARSRCASSRPTGASTRQGWHGTPVRYDLATV